MAKRNEIFPSKYLKASDLAGKPLVVEIERAPTETLGSGTDAEQKTVLFFPRRPEAAAAEHDELGRGRRHRR